ncbi:cysteine desulfurase NifS [bacterium]|jgi:cysteine desulfurase|nr:cysteine desulfurase NifS [bacterium]
MFVYLDNNATTGVAKEVLEVMLPFLQEEYGNPSSMYEFARKPIKAVEKARRQVAEFLGAAYDDEIIFTSCGSESDSTAILGSLQALGTERNEVIISDVEHPAVFNLRKHLERMGYTVKVLPVNKSGLVEVASLENVISEKTALVSVMYANNETGCIMPIEELTKIAHKHGALMHTDAVQAAGKIKLDVQKLNVDMLGISGHKIHAPKGVGALYLKRGTPFRPFLAGGHQERGRRAGTENVASIAALGKACEMAGEALEYEQTEIRRLRDKLEAGLLAIPYSYLNGDREKRTPNTTNISFEFIEGEAILLSMSDKGICASTGSACSSESLEPSHVLLAQGLPAKLAHSAVRFSLSRYTTEAEIDYVISEMPKVIERIRKMSPFWHEN